MVPGLSAFTPDFPYFVTKRLTRASGRLMLGRHDVRGAQDDFHVRGSSSREVQRMMNSKEVLRQAVRLAPATARTAGLARPLEELQLREILDTSCISSHT